MPHALYSMLNQAMRNINRTYGIGLTVNHKDGAYCELIVGL